LFKWVTDNMPIIKSIEIATQNNTDNNHLELPNALDVLPTSKQ